MVGCCAVNCKNRSGQGIKLFHIPNGKNDQERRRIWLAKIKRKDFDFVRSACLCEMGSRNGIKKSAEFTGSTKKNGPLLSYTLESKINVETSETYILNLILNHKSSTFAVSLSNQTVKLFCADKKTNIATFKGHEKTISDIKYSKENPNLLYSSSQDGNIRLWDVRAKGDPVRVFVDASDGPPKPILTFDVSLDENYICGGTELIREDAFLVFWDSRTSKNLGGYWNSHTDDITQVKYHPYKNCVMSSGSVDGLINIFDLSHDCEDDALADTLNTNSSVGSLTWHARPYEVISENKLFCLTHTEEAQIWKTGDSSPYLKLDRESLKGKDNTKSIAVDYLIDILQDEEEAFIVTGHRNGQLHVWSVNENDVKLWAQINNAHEKDIRAIDWCYYDRTIFTGGEDGIVCIWKTTNPEKLKVPSGIKKSSYKPY